MPQLYMAEYLSDMRDLSGKKSRAMLQQAIAQSAQLGIDAAGVIAAAKAGDQQRFKNAAAGWAKTSFFRRVVTSEPAETEAYFQDPKVQEWAAQAWSDALAGKQVTASPVPSKWPPEVKIDASMPSGGMPSFGSAGTISTQNDVRISTPFSAPIPSVVTQAVAQGGQQFPEYSPPTQRAPVPTTQPTSQIGGIPTTYVILGVGTIGILLLAVMLKKDKKAPAYPSQPYPSQSYPPQPYYPQQYYAPPPPQQPQYAGPAASPPQVRNRPRRRR